MLTERFGWTGPPDGKQGHYDYVAQCPPLIHQRPQVQARRLQATVR